MPGDCSTSRISTKEFVLSPEMESLVKAHCSDLEVGDVAAPMS